MGAARSRSVVFAAAAALGLGHRDPRIGLRPTVPRRGDTRLSAVAIADLAADEPTASLDDGQTRSATSLTLCAATTPRSSHWDTATPLDQLHTRHAEPAGIDATTWVTFDAALLEDLTAVLITSPPTANPSPGWPADRAAGACREPRNAPDGSKLGRARV